MDPLQSHLDARLSWDIAAELPAELQALVAEQLRKARLTSGFTHKPLHHLHYGPQGGG